MIARNVNGEVHFYNDKCTRRLISPSRLLGIFNGGKLDMIPQVYLEPAKEYGTQLGVELANFFQDKEISEDFKKPIKNILEIIEGYHPKEITFESHYGNEMFHGFIDIELNDRIIELKTRSNFRLEIETVVQCEIYKEITSKPYHIIYLNRKTSEARELLPTSEQISQAQDIIKCAKTIIEILWKIKKYEN